MNKPGSINYQRMPKKNIMRKVTTEKQIKSIATKAAKKAIEVEAETKTFDTNVTAQAVDYNAGYVVSLTNGITRGIADSQYVGDIIHPVGLRVNYQVTRADASQLFRIVLIQNRAGGLPLTATLFSSVGNLTAPLSVYDKDYNNTYRVLFDKTYSMDNVRGLTLQGSIVIGSKKLQKMYFNDAIGTVERAALYMLCISDSAVVVHPTFDYRARLFFKDI